MKDAAELTVIEIRRIRVDKGYGGHKRPVKSCVWISRQARRSALPQRRDGARFNAALGATGLQLQQLLSPAATFCLPSSPRCSVSAARGACDI
jgi:hypothetical protein